MNRPALCLSALAFACLAVACGQSGPLYLPGDPSEITVTGDEQPPDGGEEADSTPGDDDEDSGAEGESGARG